MKIQILDEGPPSAVGDEKANGVPVPRTNRLTQRPRKRWLQAFGPWFTLGLILFSLHVWARSRHRQESIVQNHLRKGGPLVGKAAEELFLSTPNEASAISASRQYAMKPHMAGSPGDLDTAKYFLELLQQELGIAPPLSTPIFPAGSTDSRNATLSIPKLDAPQAWIDIYYPVMNTPLERSLEVFDDKGDVIWEADLKEYSDETDPEAAKYSDAVPTFHGLSPAGDVKGKLVFANYGRQEDYDVLVAQGVDLNGTIVICRYGGNFRGLKVKGAQELGAAGVLIYSDPRDDGTVTPENGYIPYPHGPARNPTSVQRGSVQFISMYPGDPTTPGYPSYENSTRTEGSNIPSIPSLPISWANAKVLLKNTMKGGAWEGQQVRLVNKVDEKVTPIWNTLGVIPGHIKNEVVMIGNHRDAWVMGATDPSSGTVSVHEVVRGFGALLRKGWKPLRTIVIASWDAEEYGLIGSTEWGEDFSEWINDHVVAYLNLDSSTSGSRLSASASPLLAHLVRQTAEEIPHPTSKDRTLWDATSDDGKLLGNRADGQSIIDPEAAAVHAAEKMVSSSIGVNPLGSGSDYTVFLQRIGVPSSNGGFSSTLHDPVYHYHSVFDSERWQELYGDPGFFRHVAVAKHLGLQALRLSSAIVLPFNTTHYTYDLESYLEKVEKIASSQSLDFDLSALRASIRSLQAASLSLDFEKLGAERDLRHWIEEWNKRQARRGKLRRKLRKIYCRIRKAIGLKCRSSHKCHEGQEHHAPVVSQNGVVIKPRIGRFPAWVREQREQAENDLAYGFALQAGYGGNRLTDWPGKFPMDKLKLAVERVQAVNTKLVAFERGFISKDGIKDREWFKHLGVAPGKWLGYGATTFPALTESLTIERNTTLAEYEAGRLKSLIDSLADKIRIHA